VSIRRPTAYRGQEPTTCRRTGFTIVEASDLDVALQWGRKLSRVTTLPIEVRPLRSAPEH